RARVAARAARDRARRVSLAFVANLRAHCTSLLLRHMCGVVAGKKYPIAMHISFVCALGPVTTVLALLSPVLSYLHSYVSLPSWGQSSKQRATPGPRNRGGSPRGATARRSGAPTSLLRRDARDLRSLG